MASLEPWSKNLLNETERQGFIQGNTVCEYMQT